MTKIPSTWYTNGPLIGLINFTVRYIQAKCCLSPLYLGSFIKQKTTFVILKIVSALFRFEIPKNGKSPLYLGAFMQ